MNEKLRMEAATCLAAAGKLARDAAAWGPDPLTAGDLIPIYVLIERTEALLDGKVEARDRKNAGDRKRRARKKAPGRKPREHNPPVEIPPPLEEGPSDR